MNNNINKDELIEQYKTIQKRDRMQKIILVIIIIILLLLYFLGYKLGKIGYQEVSTIIPNGNDNIKLIKVTADDIEITKNTELNIFENDKFDGKKIIAPKSKGEYTFCVKNIADKNITYNIDFKNQMNLPVNMKYKLKIDNIYIKGDQDTYVDIEDLKAKNIIVLKDSINVFTLEWYWEDDDVNDTLVGSQQTNQYYTLNLGIQAEEYKNRGETL